VVDILHELVHDPHRDPIREVCGEVRIEGLDIIWVLHLVDITAKAFELLPKSVGAETWYYLSKL